jgi:hypothetical protein
MRAPKPATKNVQHDAVPGGDHTREVAPRQKACHHVIEQARSALGSKASLADKLHEAALDVHGPNSVLAEHALGILYSLNRIGPLENLIGDIRLGGLDGILGGGLCGLDGILGGLDGPLGLYGVLEGRSSIGVEIGVEMPEIEKVVGREHRMEGAGHGMRVTVVVLAADVSTTRKSGIEHGLYQRLSGLVVHDTDA